MFRKIIISIVVLFFLTTVIGGYLAYRTIYQPNVNLGDKKSEFIYIPTGSKFEDVLNILTENDILKSKSSFSWLAEKKKYNKSVKPGKYRILATMGNNALINLLMAGIQEPVEINFSGIRSMQQLTSRLYRRIEADSMQLYYAFNDNALLKKYNFNRENIQAIMIPDEYKFYWNTSAEQFLDKMYEAYTEFWNKARKAKAQKMNLTLNEVSILASIVQSEQCCDNEEKKVIAGLYLNRLKKGKELESDPTVIYAIGNFSIQRVNFNQLRFNSPYNTYMHKGLPPGPIAFVQKSSIDAVLNYNKNNYFYMCAKEDFSGRHNFAIDYNEHLKNAKKYREALNKRNIH